MRILLIGGTGFIGACCARTLIGAGHDVAVLSRRSHHEIESAESLIADRRDASAVAAVLEGQRFDCTVDLAAYGAADVERLLTVPYAALGRYVLISTGQVYLVTDSKRAPFREEDSDAVLTAEPPAGSPDHKEWAYGVGKRQAEGALLALRASHGVRAVILRLPIVVGDGDTSLRLWSWVERMRDGEPIVLPDGGTRLTRFIHVADVARAVETVLASEPPREVVYNLAGPDVLALRTVLEHTAQWAGVTPQFVDASLAELTATGIEPSSLPYAGPWVSVLDPSRAAAEWGFMGTRLADYLPDVVRRLVDQPPPESHPGYAQRAREIDLARRLAAASGRGGGV